MKEKVNIRFLLGAYFLLLGFIIIITTVLLAMYGNLATTTRTLTDVDGHKSAIENLGTLALSFADLIKVTVGAVESIPSAMPSLHQTRQRSSLYIFPSWACRLPPVSECIQLHTRTI